MNDWQGDEWMNEYVEAESVPNWRTRIYFQEMYGLTGETYAVLIQNAWLDIYKGIQTEQQDKP